MAAHVEAVLVPDVELARQGDVAAFSRLVERTSSMVCGVAFAIVRDIAASEDIAQEVFLSVWKGLGRLQNPRSFLPWLRQMTRNQANSWLRKVYSRRAHDHAGEELLAAVADPRPAADLALEQKEELELVARTLEEIPGEAREVLVLYYREGRSTTQVAELLGLSEGAVRKRLSRARGHIRAELAQRVGSGLERSAPGAALVTTVVTSLTTAPAPASAVGGAAAGTGVVAGLKLGGLAGPLGALAGVASSIGGVVVGLRSELGEAIDERERRQLRRLRAVAIATVVASGLGMLWSARFGHWLPPTAVFLGFVVALGLLYGLWLPRITRRRRQHQRATDPEAPARHRRRRLVALVASVAGTLMGGLGLLAGLWLGGFLG
ncbi:MAG: RNA polymerase sigma factor [Myxococcota bacterium]|nr:RNA polymerase sigma factor [Myxococcota bacterium]